MKDISVGKSKITVGFKGLISDTDENVMDMAFAKKAYNFAFENGVLTGGIGIDAGAGFLPAPYSGRHAYPAIPEGKKILNLFLYRRQTDDGKYDDRLVAHMSDLSIMYTSVFKTDTWHSVENLYLDEEVSAVNYPYKGKDVLLLSSEKDYLYIVNGDLPLVCTTAPRFTSLTVHNERLYGSVSGHKNEVWFSDDFDPLNWTVSADEAGYISFSDECGDVIKVVSFLNYLYVFREFGIFRLTAYGDQNEFLLKKVFTDTGRIVKHSITLCGDKIIFYAEDGLYAFDGYEVVRIAKQLPPIFNTHLMSCAYLDDYYYMACVLFENGTQNNAVVRYRLSDKSISVLYGYSVKKLSTLRVHNGAQVLCVFNGDIDTLGMMSDSGKVLGVPTQKKYFSPENALSSAATKVIRSISVKTDSPITITVRLDGKAYDYHVAGGALLKTMHVEHSGRTVGFEIACNSEKARISPLIVAVDTVKI